MAETKSKPIPRKDKICVWTFPEGTQPAVRVEVDGGKIKAEDLLEITGKTLGINANSLQFFGLFRGIENPTKKYGNNEFIYLPCRYVISIQKWSFDVPREQKHLKTDAGAMHLICLQCIEDIRCGRLKPKPDHIPLLKEYRNPAFPCDKQYVELCQKMFGYGYVFLHDCTIQNDVKMKEVSLTQGMQVNLIANRRGLMIKSSECVIIVCSLANKTIENLRNHCNAVFRNLVIHHWITFFKIDCLFHDVKRIKIIENKRL